MGLAEIWGLLSRLGGRLVDGTNLPEFPGKARTWREKGEKKCGSGNSFPTHFHLDI